MDIRGVVPQHLVARGVPRVRGRVLASGFQQEKSDDKERGMVNAATRRHVVIFRQSHEIRAGCRVGELCGLGDGVGRKIKNEA
jgi:hypothetical protein